MKLSFEIEGIDNLLEKFGGYTDGDKMRRALGAAGEEVRGEAADNAAVDTGRLKASIVSQVEENSVLIGPTVDYGIYVEFGTGAKGDKSVAHTTKKYWRYKKGDRFYTTSGQAPKPFLVPALKAKQQAVIDKFKEVYGE